jgi:hypothetical protein
MKSQKNRNALCCVWLFASVLVLFFSGKFFEQRRTP